MVMTGDSENLYHKLGTKPFHLFTARKFSTLLPPRSPDVCLLLATVVVVLVVVFFLLCTLLPTSDPCASSYVYKRPIVVELRIIIVRIDDRGERKSGMVSDSKRDGSRSASPLNDREDKTIV